MIRREDRKKKTKTATDKEWKFYEWFEGRKLVALLGLIAKERKKRSATYQGIEGIYVNDLKEGKLVTLLGFSVREGANETVTEEEVVMYL